MSEERSNGYSAFNIVPKAPNLVLLGNIGSFKEGQEGRFLEFLEKQLASFKIVFFILGMEETFLTTVPNVRRILQKFSQTMAQKRAEDENATGEFFFLDELLLSMPLENIVILGSTLFNPRPSGGFLRDRIESYYILANSVRPIINQFPERNIVIFTHILPCKEIIAADPNLSPLLARNIKLWAFGICGRHNVNWDDPPGRRLFCNQRGRNGARFPEFDPELVVEIKDERPPEPTATDAVSNNDSVENN